MMRELIQMYTQSRDVVLRLDWCTKFARASLYQVLVHNSKSLENLVWQELFTSLNKNFEKKIIVCIRY